MTFLVLLGHSNRKKREKYVFYFEVKNNSKQSYKNQNILAKQIQETFYLSKVKIETCKKGKHLSKVNINAL